MRFLSPQHALWRAGFRPLFLMALVMGVLMPPLWGLVFAGKISLPSGTNPIGWHAHEMLFGFGGAVLFGFLLTASKNWVKVRGIHGTGLMILTGLWLFERVFIYFISDVPPLLKHMGLSLFAVSAGGYIIWTLIKFRAQDSFRDNYFFLSLLVTMVIAKNFIVAETFYQHGIAMSIGLFRLAFVVMFERTIPQFMKNTEGVSLYRNSALNFTIKIMMAIAVFQSFFPAGLSFILLICIAGLLLARWFVWRPDIGFRKFGNGTMYLGYLGLTLNLLFEALQLHGDWSHGAYSIHVFTFLCMGVVIPSMILRISRGHTGRKPEFRMIDKVAIYSILGAAVFRLLLPIVWPIYYSTWILLAGLGWSLTFLLLMVQISPYLFKPRIDGKVH